MDAELAGVFPSVAVGFVAGVRKDDGCFPVSLGWPRSLGGYSWIRDDGMILSR